MSFTGKNSARVSTESEMIDVEFDYAIIATGTVVSRISFPGSDLCITSDDSMEDTSATRYTMARLSL